MKKQKTDTKTEKSKLREARMSNSKSTEHLGNSEQLLSRHQVAVLLSTSLRSLATMLAKGQYPKPDTHLGPQQPRWRLVTHDAWVRKQCGATPWQEPLSEDQTSNAENKASGHAGGKMKTA
jgi:predicted DNA-binding transcriptional regulator AlpA